LGRDAAHAQAGAAQGRLAVLAQRRVDAGGLQAQLRGADGGVVAGRAGTDDDDVELFSHLRFLGTNPFSLREKVARSAGGGCAGSREPPRVKQVNSRWFAFVARGG